MSAPPLATPAATAEPFVGPRAFQPIDAWRFFGRDREVADLIDVVSAARIVLLYSPSGAGKSSLLNAAVIPTLQERFRVLPVISVGKAPPSIDGQRVNRYLWSALFSLENALPEAERLPASELAIVDFPTYLARRREMDADDRPVLLVFDQFEEILAIDPFDIDAKTAFFEQVGEALRDRQRWAIFSMREEYDARLDPYRRLVPTGLTTRFRLDLLGADAAIQAIWRPTRDLPVKITVEAAEKIVDDLSRVQSEQGGEVVARQGPHVDPVQLQVVCLRLWEKRAPGATEITADDIERTGTNVDVALGEYYDETVARAAGQTGVPEREIRTWIGDHLITRHGLRNRVLREPGESRGLNDRAIEVLLGRYLLRTVPGDATWVELAHDRLVPPVLQSNEEWLAQHLSPLQRHAEAWARGGRAPDLLAKGSRLREMRAWAEEHAEQVTSTEREFLAASAAASTAAFKRWALVATAIAVVALGLMGWALVERAKAESQANLSRVQALAAQAPDQHDAGDDERGALLARQAYLFDTASGGPKREFVDASLRAVLSQPLFSAVLGHDDVVVATAFSEDGSTLTTVSGPLNVVGRAEQRPITVWRWDIHGAEVTSEHVNWPGTSLTAAAVDPGANRLAVANLSGDVWIWDLRSPNDPPVHLNAADSSVGALAFSADGTRLAIGFANGMLQIRDATAPEGEPTSLSTGKAAITGLAFHPNGATLAVAKRDGAVDLWNIDRGDRLASDLDGNAGAVGALAYSPDGATLAVSRPDLTIALVSPDLPHAMPVTLAGHKGVVRAIAFGIDGMTLASGGDDGTARLWQLGAGAAMPHLVPGGSAGAAITASALGFLPDGRLGYVTLDRQGKLREVILGEDEPAATWEGTGTGVASIALDGTDGTRAVGGCGGAVSLSTPGQPDLRWSCDPRASAPATTALAFSRDGAWLAVGGNDGTIGLQRMDGAPAEALQLRQSGADEPVAVRSLAFSPDGSSLVSGDDGGAVLAWDLRRPDAVPVHLVDNDGAIVSLAFSPDGTTLATGDADGTIRLQSVSSPGALPIVLRGPVRGPVTALVFSPDGALLFTAHADGSVRSWIARTDVLADIVCRQVRRNLSAEEWKEYVGLPVEDHQWMRLVGLSAGEYEPTCPALPPGMGAPGGPPAAIVDRERAVADA